MPLKPLELPPIEMLKQLFALRDDGRIINRISRTARKAGNFADNSTRAGGYRVVYADGKLHSAHRVAFALAYGRHPVGYLDHINRDVTDNRPENLRECSHAENMMNKKIRCDNSSGIKGVHLRPDTGKWRAYISIDGKRVNVGQFETMSEANQAVREARAKFHGQFAREA